MLSEYRQNRIHTVNVHSTVGNSPGLRLGVSKMLGSAVVQPAGMAPSSILLINKITQHFPNSASKLYGVSAEDELKLKASLRRHMESYYRNAVRPSNGRINKAENSVIFADKSELIACLCYSAVKGRVANEWWWRCYFSHAQLLGASTSLGVSSMLETPQIVPAILKHLTEWCSATSFVKLVDNASLERLTSAVLHTYGLSDFDQQLHNPDSYSDIPVHLHVEATKPKVGDTTEAPYEGNSGERFTSTNVDEYSGIESADASPFSIFYRSYISESGLSKAQIGLLGIAHLLQESPMVLRDPIVKSQLIKWWHSESAVEYLEDAKQEEVPLQNYKKSSALVDKIRQRTDAKSAEERQGDFPSISFDYAVDKEVGQRKDETHGVKNQKVREVPDYLSLVSERAREFRNNVSSQLSSSEQLIEPENRSTNQSKNYQPTITPDYDYCEQFTDTDRVAVERDHQGPKTNVDQEPLEESSSDSDIFLADNFCDTQLGGLLYLINLLKQIDLPDCLEGAPDLRQHLSSWALLDAVARALLGGNFTEYKKDPIWGVLAGLDKRKLNAAIGNDFPPYQNHTMPQKWFAFFSEGASPTFYWATHNNRLRIWFDAGVLVERDIDGIGKVEDQIFEVVRSYSSTVFASQIIEQKFGQAPIANRKQLERAGINKELAKLLSLILPSIRKYLQRTLDLNTSSPNQLLQELLSFEARIFIGPSHLDLTTNVNSSSFPIRCSGLDQDPGWLAEYGRVVLFHFSQP